MRNVGELLRLKRLEKGYTLEKTAKLVGVSINYIAKLEKGENSNPSDEYIVRLAKVLGLDENSLFKSFNKIPLSTRQALHAHPHLADAFSEIANNKELSDEKKEEFLRKIIYWYKKLNEEEE
ncbi:helix-turn-helix domain-containing protein [Peribacillus asahii]|uniref:helix-turn-helix domain-containing protein n=1 Tax=Peribacillus asahii TaxID=228899 RepID=UPI0038211CDC